MKTSYVHKTLAIYIKKDWVVVKIVSGKFKK